MTEISFEFIQHPDLKASLVSDYREMVVGQESGSWKSVHVLAGSIVEALLVDELVFIHSAEEAQILNTTFEKLIERCAKERLLTKRAAELSTVVRGFRNLIHPGRLLRLQETVDEDGANTAVALVRMVVKEVAARRVSEYGLRAEQVMEKILKDPMNHAAHGHLEKSLQEKELVRLVTDVIPTTLEGLDVDAEHYDIGRAMRSAIMRSINWLPAEKKGCVAAVYAKLIKEGGAAEIDVFERHLFDGFWLWPASVPDRALIVEHLSDKFVRSPNSHLLLIRGLNQYFTSPQRYRVTRVAARFINDGGYGNDNRFREACREFILGMWRYAKAEDVAERQGSLDMIVHSFQGEGLPEVVRFLTSFKVSPNDEYDPFADE